MKNGGVWRRLAGSLLGTRQIYLCGAVRTITTVICNNIAFALSLFASLATIVLLFGLAKKKAEEDSDIEI